MNTISEEISQKFFKFGKTYLLSRLNQPGLPVSFMSKNLLNFLGLEENDIIHSEKTFIDFIHIDDLINLQDHLLELNAKQVEFLETEYRIKNKFNEFIYVKDTINPEYDKQGNVIAYHGYLEDISDSKKQDKEIESSHSIDEITQLPNRKNILNVLNQYIENSKRNKLYGSLLLINIDRFKFINYQYGFEVGDKLLNSVAKRLKATVRSQDYLARTSSDEFVIIITDLNNNKQKTIDKSNSIAVEIRELLSATYEINKKTIKISTSLGICVFPEQKFKSDKILKFAELALTHSKSNGQNNIKSFDLSMRQENKYNLNLEKDLIYAIDNKELELHFQPIVNKDRNIIAFESLLRWEHLTQGNIPPTEFIPLAENTGLLQQLGEYVIEKACDQLSIWQQENVVCDERIQYLSVNVSPNQFWHANFESHLKENIVSKKINPKHLLIEITENIFVGDIEVAIKKINEIKKLGVKIALDDFGSGYSSLSYLMKLPIDIVKLDRAFVQNVHLDEVKATIIKSVCEIAKKLKLKVIAEGLETTEELQVLVRYDCDAYQGYYFFRPSNLPNLKKILQIKPQIGFNDFNNTIELPSDKQNAHVFSI